MTAVATIVGNLGSDPEKKTSGSGKNFVVFSVAVNGFRDGEQDTTWFDCVAFGEVGKFVAQHVKKGSSVAISGKLGIDKWEKDGVKHSKPKIVANMVDFINTGAKKDENKQGGDFAAAPSGGQGDFQSGGSSDW